MQATLLELPSELACRLCRVNRDRCRLSDVAAMSAKRAWAVGSDGSRAVMFHWVKPRWIRARLTAIPGTEPMLWSVARIPGQPGHLWSIGGSFTKPGWRTALILRRG